MGGPESGSATQGLEASAARGLATIYEKIRSDDTTLGAENQLMAFDEFNDLIGVEAKYAMTERYGVK